MRIARAVILSVSCVLGFACTGEDGAGDGKSGTEKGGSGGNAGSSGSGGTASGGSGTGASGGTSTGGTNTGGTSNGGTSTGGTSAGTAGDDAGAGGAGAGAGGAGTGGAGAGGASNGGADAGNGGSGGMLAAPSLLVFSRTTGFRHDSIPDGIAALRTLAQARNWDLQASEDPTIFTDSGLAPFNVLVFLSTSGDIFTTDQKAAFERYVRSGRGYVGIHAASTTEYEWPFYGELVGAFFREHPAIQEAVIHVETANHPSTATLPTNWRRTDEWYAFRTNPRPNVTVLLTLDESTYAPSTSTMGADHPIAWFHVYEGARSFYTALGHMPESYTEPNFIAHVAGGIEWAAGR